MKRPRRFPTEAEQRRASVAWAKKATRLELNEGWLRMRDAFRFAAEEAGLTEADMRRGLAKGFLKARGYLDDTGKKYHEVEIQIGGLIQFMALVQMGREELQRMRELKAKRERQ